MAAKINNTASTKAAEWEGSLLALQRRTSSMAHLCHLPRLLTALSFKVADAVQCSI
jgi:hypothetical protein